MEDRIAALEARLQRLEDELAIIRLVTEYSPRVDSGSAEEVAALWTQDGRYDYEAGQPDLIGRDGIRAMVRSDAHQGLIHSGVAHVTTTPRVHLDGDRAVATGYSLLIRHDPEGRGYRVARCSANRWELVRDGDTWRAVRRVNRLLDGSDEARELLRAVTGTEHPSRTDETQTETHTET